MIFKNPVQSLRKNKSVTWSLQTLIDNLPDQTKTPTVRADGESFVQRCLVDAWHRAQDLPTLIQWLRDNHTSPWSLGGPLAATLSSYDPDSAEIRDTP